MSAAFDFNTVNRGDDSRWFVVFYDKTIHNPQRSAELGRPEYDVKCYVRMQEPGDNLSIHDRPATDFDMRRFPAQYRAYTEGRGTEQPGTPIELLFPANPELVAMFKHLKITTVQVLAALEGNGLASVGMGAQEFKQKAQRYLDASKEGEAFTKMQGELAQRDQEIAALKQQNTEVMERLDKLTKLMERQVETQVSPGPDIELPKAGMRGTPPKKSPFSATGEI